MRILIFFLLSLGLVCGYGIAANFTEDFSKSKIGEDWVAVDEPAELLNDKGPSSWVINNGPINGGALNQSSNIWGDVGDVVALGTFCIYDKMEWVNFDLSFEMLANDNDGTGFVWGWKDRTNHYRFFTMIDAGNPGGAAGAEGDPGKAPWSLIEKRTGDKRPYYKTLKVVREAAYQQGALTTFRVVVQDGKFQVYSNGDLIIEASDPSYAGGKIGFTLYAQSGNFFDNIELIDQGSAVEHNSKIVSTWGLLKSSIYK